MKTLVAAIVLGGVLCAACGAAVHRESQPLSSPFGGTPVVGRGTFVECSAPAGGASTYAIVNTPGSGCRELVAGRDYADGRVIIGLKSSATDAEVGQALAAFHATVVSSQPALGDRVLAVPKGSVPEAVVGLAGYPFITFAAPDMLNKIDPSKV